MCRISVISMWLYCTVEKCVDPDQLASPQKPADLDLHFFFQKWDLSFKPADLDLHFFQTGPIRVKFSKYPTHLYPRAHDSDKAVFSCLLTKTCFNKVISTKLDDYLVNEFPENFTFSESCSKLNFSLTLISCILHPLLHRLFLGHDIIFYF